MDTMKSIIRDSNKFYEVHDIYELREIDHNWAIQSAFGGYMYSEKIDMDYEASWEIHTRIYDYWRAMYW